MVEQAPSGGQLCATHTREVARMTARIPPLRHPPVDAVMLSTIHSAKGIEWDTMFLAGLEDSTLPSRHADTEGAGRGAPHRLRRHDAGAVPSPGHLRRRAIRRERLTIAVPLEIPGRNIHYLRLDRAPRQGRRRALAVSWESERPRTVERHSAVSVNRPAKSPERRKGRARQRRDVSRPCAWNGAHRA